MARGEPGEETYEPRVQPEDLPRKIVPRMEAAPIGAAFAQATEATEQKYKADSAIWAGDEVAQFRTQAITGLQAAKDNAPPGDMTGFTQRYLQDFDKQAAPLLEQSSANPVTRQIVTHGLNNLRDTLYEHTVQWEAEQNDAYRVDAVQKHVASQTALVEAHPELASQVGSTLMDEINSIPGGNARRLPLARYMDSQLTLAAANGLTRQDPRGALEALNDPEHADPKLASVVVGLNDAQREAVRSKANEHLSDGVYAALSGGHIGAANAVLNQNADLMDAKTHDSLQRAINAQQEHQIVMADKAQADTSKRLLTDMIYRSTQGTLTPAYVNSMRNSLEPAAYEYGLKLASGKEATTDSHTYLDLLNRQSRGEDVRGEAMVAASQGLLDKADAGRLIEGSAKEVPSLYKRGHDYIQTAGQVSQLEPDPAKTQTLANMQNDWNDAFQQHQQEWEKDPAKAEVEFKSIVSRYQLVKADQNLIDASGAEIPHGHAHSARHPGDEEGNRRGLSKGRYRSRRIQ